MQRLRGRFRRCSCHRRAGAHIGSSPISSIKPLLVRIACKVIPYAQMVAGILANEALNVVVGVAIAVPGTVAKGLHILKKLMSLKYRNPKAGVKVVQIVQNLRLGTQKSGRNGKFEIDEPFNSTLRRKSCECSECGSQTLFQKRNMQISLRGRQRNQENIYFRDRRRQTLN